MEQSDHFASGQGQYPDLCQFFQRIMKEKLFLHITKRSEHVLQWSKANFFTFFLTSFLACFFNATRKKLVTLDFYIFHEIK